MSNAQVIFKTIPRFPSYKFGSDGSVWSLRNGRRMKHRLNRGAPMLTLCERNHKTNHYVSRLIAEAFHGPCPKGMEVRHFPDRDQTNNTPSNLTYGTHKQNIADQLIHGTRLFGDASTCAKLTTAQVMNIFRLYRGRTNTQVELAAMYGVAQSLISAIVNGIRWPHLGGAR